MASSVNNDLNNKTGSNIPTINLAGYLRSLPPDYLIKSPWASRQNTRNLVPYAVSPSSRTSTPVTPISKKTSKPLSTPSTYNLLKPATSSSSVPHSLDSGSTSDGHRHVVVNPSEDSGSTSDGRRHVVANPSDYEETNIEVDETSQSEQILLSICWYRQYLGAAFYDATTRQAYVIEDKVESSPEFWVLRTLFRETSPKIILLGGKQDSRFFEVIQELRGLKDSKKQNSVSRTTSGTSGNIESSSDESNKRKKLHGESSSVTSSDSPLSGSQRSSTSLGSILSTVGLVIRPSSEFKYESCYKRVFLYHWPGLSRESSDLERESWLRSKLNLNAIAAVRALGGLMGFLEQKGNEILPKNTLFSNTPILGLHSFHIDDLVHVDEDTIAFLQVFSEDLHPAASKKGKSSASKEGLSLFALLSRTASSLSSHVLRRVILRPVRNVELLESRYEFLGWAMQPANFDTIRQLQACLKNICNVQLLFSRLQRGQLSIKDWKALYQSLSSLIIITEICSSQRHGIDVFKQVSESKSDDLYQVTHLIQRTVDFDQGERDNRFVVKPGLDHCLDDQKRKLSGLSEVLYQVSELQLTSLPPDVGECGVIYLPHIGFLMGVNVAEAAPYLAANVTCQGNSTVTETYDIPGLTFKFCSSNMVFFKSDMCYELDNEFGDLSIEIANQETSIMMRLIEVILLQSQTFVHLVSKAFYLDVLLAFASVSRDFGWTRPTLNTTGDLQIKEGRHPLYEVCNPTFVSNDILGRVKDSPISIITGPNSSGKTAYTKQVGVIAYLAHLGCYVPAEKMIFRPMDALFSVAMDTPSVTSGLSTFMFDLNRLTIAVLGSTNRSLVLIDEFGASTYEFDGASLMVSVVDFWTSQLLEPNPEEGESKSDEGVSFSGRELKTAMVTRRGCQYEKVKKGCPLVFVSTHFYRLHNFLRNPQFVKELCMDTLQEGNRVIHLYQVVEGRTRKSYALQVAQAAGLTSVVVNRAKEIHSTLTFSTLPSHWRSLCGSGEIQKCSEIVEEFLSYDFTASPLSDLVTSLRKYLNDTSSSSANNTSDTGNSLLDSGSHINSTQLNTKTFENQDARHVNTDLRGVNPLEETNSEEDLSSIHPDTDDESPGFIPRIPYEGATHSSQPRSGVGNQDHELDIYPTQSFDILHGRTQNSSPRFDQGFCSPKRLEVEETLILNLYNNSD